RQDCSNILQLQADEPQRIIKVEWGDTPQSFYSVDVVIEAYDRYGLLKDITTLLDQERINIIALQTLSDKRKNTAHMQVTVEIRSRDEQRRILTKRCQLPHISSARRKQGSSGRSRRPIFHRRVTVPNDPPARPGGRLPLGYQAGLHQHRALHPGR